MPETTDTTDAGETIVASLTRVQALVAQLGAEYSTITDELHACQRAAYQRGGIQGGRDVGRLSDGLAGEIAALMLGAGLEPVLRALANDPITELVPIWSRRIAAGQLATARRTRAD